MRLFSLSFNWKFNLNALGNKFCVSSGKDLQLDDGTTNSFLTDVMQSRQCSSSMCYFFSFLM